jgi:hypothetical protein
MTLRELMGDVCPRVAGQAGSLRLGEVPEVEISGLAYSSRSVTPGTLFFCVPGFRVDGHDFAPDGSRWLVPLRNIREVDVRKRWTGGGDLTIRHTGGDHQLTGIAPAGRAEMLGNLLRDDQARHDRQAELAPRSPAERQAALRTAIRSGRGAKGLSTRVRGPVRRRADRGCPVARRT